MKCPCCKGTGRLKDRPLDITFKKQLAKVLSQLGFTVREIQKMLDYKSPNSIQRFLKRKYEP